MKIEVNTERTVREIIDLKRAGFLKVNPEYQRGLRWDDVQKRMFIDSIFRGYSIPAFYFHKIENTVANMTNTFYEIVDGQQRIDAIYSYSEGGFALLDPANESGFGFPNFVKDDPCPWGGKRFSELSDDIKDELMSHQLVVYDIATENENSIRDLFIRLQGGVPLSAQDKRDSWPGNFTEFVLATGGKSGVDKWPGKPVFKCVKPMNNESRRRQLVAQTFMLYWTVRKDKKFCDIKSSNIDDFYRRQVGFDAKSTEARDFLGICDKVGANLKGWRTLPGHYIIHLILLVDSLTRNYVAGTWEADLPEQLTNFDEKRKAAADKHKQGEDAGKYYTEYGQLTQTRSDGAITIRRRHAFFANEMLRMISPTKLDGKRSFTDTQRQIVFFRDMELCQWCSMGGKTHKISWEESEIHHVTPHAAGGETEVGNAALMHKDCHPKSTEKTEKFSQWWRDGKPTMP